MGRSTSGQGNNEGFGDNYHNHENSYNVYVCNRVSDVPTPVGSHYSEIRLVGNDWIMTNH